MLEQKVKSRLISRKALSKAFVRDQIHGRFNMMTSSNGNIFRVTGPLCGEFTGPGEFPTQSPLTRSFDVFFDLRLNNDWVNNREAGDLRRHNGHYDVNVMTYFGTTQLITIDLGQ